MCWMHAIWFVWLEGREQKMSRENDDVGEIEMKGADKKVVCGITNVWATIFMMGKSGVCV